MDALRCHNYDLDSPLDRETGLDIFKVDPEYEQHEAEYKVTNTRPLAVCCIFGNIACLMYSFRNDLAVLSTCTPGVTRAKQHILYYEPLSLMPLTERVLQNVLLSVFLQSCACVHGCNQHLQPLSSRHLTMSINVSLARRCTINCCLHHRQSRMRFWALASLTMRKMMARRAARKRSQGLKRKSRSSRRCRFRYKIHPVFC